MNKQNNPILIISTISITLIVLGVISFLINKIFFEKKNSVIDVEITLLGDTFSGYSTFRSEEFQEKLQEIGITLNYENEFDQSKRANLLNEGDADLYVTTLDQFLKQQPQGKIVGLVDRTIGADAVVLNTQKYPQLKSLRDLKELSDLNQGNSLGITYAVDTPSEYLALVLSTSFEEFNLNNFEVEEVVDASEAWKALQDKSQNIAVAVLWEPFVTQARKQGYTVVLSSKDAPTAILDVIVASNDLLNQQPEVISNFLEAYYRRIDTNLRDTSGLKNEIAEDGNLSKDEATTILDGIDFFTSIEAKNWISDGILEKRINSTAAVLVLSEKMNQLPQNITELFTSQFIDKAASNTQKLIDLVRLDNPELADILEGKDSLVANTPNLTSDEIINAEDIGNVDIQGEVKFAHNSSILTEESEEILNKLAEKIKDFNPQTVAIQVIGHTSKIGNHQYNQKLSQKRAEVVVNLLQKKGLSHNIIPEGKGFYLPLSGMKPEDPRQQRTEIRLVRINE